jgi:hypothetical protein
MATTTTPHNLRNIMKHINPHHAFLHQDMLPEELLALIFSHISISKDLFDGVIDSLCYSQADCENISTLVSLCLVSKQCCRLVRPLLYQTILLFDGLDSWVGLYRLRKLVRTLIYQPLFTRYIKEISVDAAFLDDNWGECEEDSWDLFYEDTVDASRAFNFDNGSHQHLLNHLRDGKSGAHTALLLALCEDVEIMRIAMPADLFDSHYFTSSVLSNAGHGTDPSVESESLALSSLKVLSVHNSDPFPCIQSSDLANLFQLGKLESFKGFGLDFTTENNQYDTFASNVTRIDLDQCLIDAGGLKSILQACPKLQDLAVVWAPHDLEDCEINFQDFGDQLRRHGKRLKKLTLNLTHTDFDHDGGGGLGDLSQMKSLETLTLPAHILVGRSGRSTMTLPTSLKWLNIDLFDFSEGEDYWQKLHLAVKHGNSHNLLVINARGISEKGLETFWNRATGFHRDDKR